jgi:hypothetical protein
MEAGFDATISAVHTIAHRAGEGIEHSSEKGVMTVKMPRKALSKSDVKQIEIR